MREGHMKRRTLLAAMGASVLMPVQAKDMPNQASETGWQNWSHSIAPQKADIVVPQDVAALMSAATSCGTTMSAFCGAMECDQFCQPVSDA